MNEEAGLQVITIPHADWRDLKEQAGRIAFLERLLGPVEKSSVDSMQSLLAQFSGTGDICNRMGCFLQLVVHIAECFVSGKQVKVS